MSNYSNSTPSDVNRAPQLLAALWIPFPVTIALLAARLYVRIVKRKLGCDGWFMVIAWVRTSMMSLRYPTAAAPFVFKLTKID